MHVAPEEGLYNININVRDNFMKSSFDVKINFRQDSDISELTLQNFIINIEPQRGPRDAMEKNE